MIYYEESTVYIGRCKPHSPLFFFWKLGQNAMLVLFVGTSHELGYKMTGLNITYRRLYKGADRVVLEHIGMADHLGHC